MLTLLWAGALWGLAPTATPATRPRHRHAGRIEPASQQQHSKKLRRAGPTTLAALAKRPSEAGAVGARLRDTAPLPPEGDRDRERIVRLQDALRGILDGRALARARIGVRVASVATGRLFYSRHPDTLMDPASNQKVLATTAALMRLGADWTYRTELTSAEPSADGVIAGNLYVRGNGDPSLRASHLCSWAAKLRSRGITQIEGGVIADARRLGDDLRGGGVAAGPARAGGNDTGGADTQSSNNNNNNSGTSSSNDRGSERFSAPLIVDRGVTLVRVQPGPTAGSPATVLTYPASAPGQKDDDRDRAHTGFTIVNRAVTKEGGRTRVMVRIGVAGGNLRIDVSGRIALGAAGVSFRRRVPHPALHAAILIRAALVAEGISVRDSAALGNAPSPAGFVLVHRSAPLATLLRRINKDSDNDQAEHVLQTVGAEARGGALATEKGLAVLREVVGALGLKPNDYVPRNGSGLGHANRITPTAMTALLTALYFDPRVGPDILQSLSVGGVDGTTRNRFKGTLAAHRVRVKTGTLNGKSCLSGLVGDGNDILVFSMMMQGFRGRSLQAVRASQVGAVNAMMRYVREGTGERIDWPTTFDETNVPTDVETGGEVRESGTEGEPENPDDIMPPTLDLGDTPPPKAKP